MGALADADRPPPEDLQLSYDSSHDGDGALTISNLMVIGKPPALASQAAGLPTFQQAGQRAGHAAALSQVTPAQQAAVPITLHIRVNMLRTVRTSECHCAATGGFKGLGHHSASARHCNAVLLTTQAKGGRGGPHVPSGQTTDLTPRPKAFVIPARAAITSMVLYRLGLSKFHC